MEPDLILHRLAFGGFALEPVTDDGDLLIEGAAPDFLHPAACLTGLPNNAVGFEPYRGPDLWSWCSRLGLIVHRRVESFND